MNYVGSILLAYLLGAIPFGYLLPMWLKGQDVRSYGSGNIGFTNVLRTFGPALAALVLIGDASKGYLAVKLTGASAGTLLPLLAAMAAVVGHNWTIFLRFKGGRGIATSAGVLLALMPWVVLLLVAVWAIVLALFRYVSLASVVAAASFPIITAIFGYPPLYIFFSLVLGALAIWRHTPNIKRLLAGKELKLGQRGEKNVR